MKIRHGDVNLYPTDEAKGKEIEHKGSVIIAEGETTGHHHVLKSKDMRVLQTENGTFYITLKTEGSLTHPEHKTLVVPPSTYRVGKEREVDHFAGSVVRKVID